MILKHHCVTCLRCQLGIIIINHNNRKSLIIVCIYWVAPFVARQRFNYLNPYLPSHYYIHTLLNVLRQNPHLTKSQQRAGVL